MGFLNLFRKKKFDIERHEKIASMINDLLAQGSFSEQCVLINDKKGAHYKIINPYKNDEALVMYYDKKYNAILNYTQRGVSVSHIHIDGLVDLENPKIAENFYGYLHEIMTNSILVFQIRYEDDEDCFPFMGGYRLVNGFDDVYDEFKNDDYYEKANTLIIKSWSGNLDKVFRDKNF